MSETMQVVFAILQPEDVLTEPVIVALRQLFGDRLVNEIGNLPAWKIANEIIARGEGVNFPTDAKPVAVAAALLGFMRTAEFVTNKPSSVPTPVTVNVVPEKTPGNMNARELLELLTSDPSLASELIPHIERLDLVRQAARKSRSWVITNLDGTINVDATLTYLNHLAKPFSIAGNNTGGRRPLTLAQALGRDERPMLNPFAFRSTCSEEMLVTGPIFGSYDLANLSDEHHLAYIWAAVTAHRAWPQVIDPYEHIPAAFAEPLTGRWLQIVEDYRAAVAAHEPETEGLTRYAMPSLIEAAERAATVGAQASQPVHDTSWYQQRLYEVAEPRVQSASRSVHRGPNDIVVSIQTASGSVHLDGTMILEFIQTATGGIRGTALGAPGCTVRTTTGNQSLSIRRMTWQALYEEALRRGIFS